MSRSVRVHTRQPLAAGDRIRLEAGPARHLVRVLRREHGDPVTVFNGDGSEYPGTIVEARAPDTCLVELGQAVHPAVESPLDITLIQAIGRGDRMDWCIQKACELGVSAILPVMTERTEVRLSGARAEKRQAHWQGVAIAACEQSGRCRVPAIAEPQPLTMIEHERGVSLVLDPEAEASLAEITLPDPPSFRIAVGPEGGFSEAERILLRQRGFSGLRLGPRILRTETAGPALIAAM
ncbi:MAG: 16S rRNA (uracil(1498)-N(3))-methyltransferase [Wenzhouxiangella sp.]